MQNYKMKIAYDGTRYSGWQHQPGQETVQGKLEMVLARMCGLKLKPRDFMDPGCPIKVIAAGRTDAGVHARGMIVSVELDTPWFAPGPWQRKIPAWKLEKEGLEPPKNAKHKMTEDEIRDYMNHYLTDDIAVTEVREAGDRFHARYKACGKTYQYTCFDGPVRPVFNRKYYTYLDQEVDVDAMQEAARYLIGEHDFKSFCGNSHMKKSTVRTVDSIEIRRSKGYVYLTFHGTGFLQNMVRILTGTLLEVGKHKMEPEQVKEILEAKDRSVAGPTAPAKGLCMIQVDYQ